MASLMTNHADAYLIIDAGGTYLKSAILDREGEVCDDSDLMAKACSEGSKEEILGALQEVIVKGLAYIKNNRLTLCGIGIAFPGPFDCSTGVSRMDHKFKNIKGVSLREFIYGIPGVLPSLPVVFKHDANSVVAGELWKGNAQGYQNAAVITLGTGLGFACSKKGVVQCNEIGGPLITIFRLPYRDGILEDYVSKRGIQRIYREKSGKDGNGIEVVNIGKMADAGELSAKETFEEVGRIIAENIRGILEERQIECLLFGGQISRSFKHMEGALKEGLKNVSCLRKISTVKNVEKSALAGVLKQSMNQG